MSEKGSDNSFYFYGSLNLVEYPVLMAISEGSDRQEIGFSILNTDSSPIIYFNQVIDTFWFSEIVQKVLLFDVKVILLPDTLFNAMAIPKCLQIVREKFSDILFIKQNFRNFDYKTGMEIISKICAPEYMAEVTKKIQSKTCAIASIAGLYDFLVKKEIRFAQSSLKMEYVGNFGKLSIDVDTVHRLELVESVSVGSSKKHKFSLLKLMDTCVTKMGRNSLRSCILEPSCDLQTIRERQGCIAELMEANGIMFHARMGLEPFKEIHRLMKLPYSITITDSAKSAETMLNLVLLLKNIIQSIKPLTATIDDAKSQTMQHIYRGLSNPLYETILQKISEFIEPEIQAQKTRTYFQKLFMVKSGVNEFLDVLRLQFSTNIDEMRAHVDSVAAKYNLPFKMIHTVNKGFYIRLHLDKTTRSMDFPGELQVTTRTNKFVCLTTAKLYELNDNIMKIANQVQIMSNMIISQLYQDVRSEIHIIYSLIDFITELDVILALAEFSKSKAQCRPEFGPEIEILDAVHPLLELSSQPGELVKNNVMANPDYNFFIISGNNMCGKTTYIKMIATLQILAQIGCYVPAKVAKFRICDKVLSRIGFEDNIERNLSSFTAEMNDMEFILRNLTPSSLVIIDELCRSTNLHDAQLLSWSYCEKLITFTGFSKNSTDFASSKDSSESSFHLGRMKLSDIRRPFIFLVTHFEHLFKLPDTFLNATVLRLNETKSVTYGNSQETDIQLKLAKFVRFPPSIVKKAEGLLNSGKFSQLTFDRGDGSFNAINASLEMSGYSGTPRELYDIGAIMGKVFRNPTPNQMDWKAVKDALMERIQNVSGTNFSANFSSSSS